MHRMQVCSFVHFLKLTHSLLVSLLLNSLLRTGTSLWNNHHPGSGHGMAKHPIISWHFPQIKNSRMDNWSIAKRNIKPGIAFAGLLMSGHSAPVLQNCFYVLNVMLSTKLIHQWLILSMYNSVFLKKDFSCKF